MKLERIEDRFTLWILSSMGLFDMMYLMIRIGRFHILPKLEAMVQRLSREHLQRRNFQIISTNQRT